MQKVQFIETSPTALVDLIDERTAERLKEFQKNFTPKEPEDFLTRKETADLLKISLVTLHQWVHKKIIKPYKFGNKTYFSRKQIIEQMYNSNK
jgi:excisionase family DNA binding protein